MKRLVLIPMLSCAAVVASLALAQAPEQSLRPVLRSDTVAPAATPAPAPAPAKQAAPVTTNAPSGSIRPAARPEKKAGKASAAAAAAPAAAAAASTAKPKPAKTKSGGLFAKRKLRRGSVCGDIDLQGQAIGNVAGKGGCGVTDAVKLTSVSGVLLSQPSIMNCTTALALKEWVDDGVIPAFKRRGKVVEMKVAGHYSCRTRNHKAGAKLSEHAKGNAIDISAFKMKDGKVYTVEESWWRGRARKPMRKAYAKACGPFGTTLGPTADKYHQDHFHLDTARYRGGPYCK